MQNYVQKGQTLTVVAPYALLSGGGCQVGNIFGVSVNNQNLGDSSELVVEGVFAGTTHLGRQRGRRGSVLLARDQEGREEAETTRANRVRNMP